MVAVALVDVVVDDRDLAREITGFGGRELDVDGALARAGDVEILLHDLEDGLVRARDAALADAFARVEHRDGHELLRRRAVQSDRRPRFRFVQRQVFVLSHKGRADDEIYP